VKLPTLNLFVTGATGYIGGSVATRLVAEGHRVRGLARDGAKADALAAFGIDPVVGDLADEDLLSREARAADVVVNAANADDLASVEVLIAAMSGSGKLLVHTSSSSVVGDDARGNSLSSKVFDEATTFVVAPAKQARHQLNQAVLAAAQSGMRTAVICPTLIYGAGRGLNKQSIQIPFLVDEARRRGAVHIVGTGINRWSTVHIDDLTDLYSRVVTQPDSDGFYFAENGEDFPAFEALVPEIVAATQKEPGTLIYEYSVNADRTVAHILERYRADAVVSHVDNTFAPFAERFLDLAKITGLVVYGNPDAEVRKRLDPFNAVYMESFGGFSR
jgi:nucleoside-diphosphate-sugar epimerase